MDARLATGRIRFEGAAEMVCHGVLEECEKYGDGIARLLAVVRRDYPEGLDGLALGQAGQGGAGGARPAEELPVSTVR